MTLFLKESADCCRLLPLKSPDNQNNFQPKTYEFQLYDPEGISHGKRSWFHLRPGISVLIEDYQLQENLIIETAPTQACTFLELGFGILGNSYDTNLNSGQNFISLDSDTDESNTKEWLAQERILKVDIHIEYSFFESLVLSYLHTLPDNFQDVIKNVDTNYFQVGRTTPQMQTILQQISNCPYQGLTKQLYLEGKVLELMALRLEDLQDTKQLNSTTNLKPEQIDSIHQAREIIISNFSNPPSLLTLARQVNLNDCTLKKGFQQIFGTTVFGYLHDYRMERAKELLLEANRVNKVAHTVGYSSHSAFMTAFRKKFGVNPSAYSRKNSV